MKKNLKYLMLGLGMFFIGNSTVFAANDYIKCGDHAIPAPIPGITSTVVLLLQIVLPIVLIVIGSLDFAKAVTAGDQDKISKAQKQFAKRLVSAGIFFFVFVIIRFAASIAADAGEGEGLLQCVDCIISGDCEKSTVDSPFK